MTAGNLNHFQRHRFNRGAGSMAGDCEHQPPPPGVTKTQGSRVITVITTGEKIMPMGMPEWDGTPESAREINCAFNAVLDVLVNAGMWTGDPPYRGKCAAEQVRMLVQRATTGEQLATDILAELATERARAEAAEEAAHVAHASLRREVAASCEFMQRTEAAETELSALRRYADDADKSTMARIAKIDQLEAKLATIPAYASYYAAAWERFEADGDGPEPLDFDEWLAQRASSQRSE